MEKIIKLKKEWALTSIKYKLAIFAVKIGLVVGTACIISQGASISADYLSTKFNLFRNYIGKQFVTTEIVKEYVTKESRSTKELILSLSKEFKVSPILTLAIAHQESGSELRADRLRFEPKVYDKFKSRYTEETGRIMASSIGLLQVIPAYHFKTCNLTSYSELFDRETNIRCGLKVLTECLKLASKGSKVSQYTQALTCYNGSSIYADEIFSRLGQLALEENLL